MPLVLLNLASRTKIYLFIIYLFVLVTKERK